MGEKGESVPADARIIPLSRHEFVTSSRTLKLLLVTRDDPDEIADMNLYQTISAETIGGTVTFDTVPCREPSTIYTQLPVKKSRDPSSVPRPGYFPSYAGLTPEQKWVYLDWLRDVRQPVDISYVFVYYYGLERHLLLGHFDLAFDEILLLRQYHRNGSFLSYSGSALLHSCVLRKRPDRWDDLEGLGKFMAIGDAELLLAFKLGMDLDTRSLMKVAKRIYGVNRRYHRLRPRLFLMMLEESLTERFGRPALPFASKYHLKDVPRQLDTLFANISFPHTIRSPEMPSFLEHAPFTDTVKEVLADAHDRVKLHLREERKRKRRAEKVSLETPDVG